MNKDRLDDMLAAIPLPIVLIGTDSRIITANDAGEAILGPGQIGRHHALALRQPALLAAIDSAFRDGIAGQAQHVILGPGHEVTYRVSVTPLFSTPTRLVLCSFEDITEQELISQFRRDFIANISHELRTPLTSLLGFIETLRGAAQDDPDARSRFLAIMAREADRMSRLVDDLLSLSKVEAQERQRPTTMVDTDELIRAVIASFRPLADAAGMSLNFKAADAVPQIPADADQLTQVLQNLVENAIKYGPLGQCVTISTHVLDDEAMLRIDVKDQGEGIEARHLPRLTERFYRADNHRSREKGGTGLGLAIVKHIINRHRGRLLINSKRGEGSCFSVFLPMS